MSNDDLGHGGHEETLDVSNEACDGPNSADLADAELEWKLFRRDFRRVCEPYYDNIPGLGDPSEVNEYFRELYRELHPDQANLADDKTGPGRGSHASAAEKLLEEYERQMAELHRRAESAEVERVRLRERVKDLFTSIRTLRASPARQQRRRWWQRKPHTEPPRDEADRGPWVIADWVVADPPPRINTEPWSQPPWPRIDSWTQPISPKDWPAERLRDAAERNADDLRTAMRMLEAGPQRRRRWFRSAD